MLSFMPIIAPKIKPKIDIPGYRQFGKLKIISLVVIGLILFAFGLSIYFVYRNIYQTIGEMQSIIILKSQMNTEVINFDKLQKVKEKWAEKQTSTTPQLNRDPFYAAPTTSTLDITTHPTANKK